MSYNFDPDRWYDNELAHLEALHRKGRLNDAAFESAQGDLDRRYEIMCHRLDGTYRIEP